MGRSSLRASTLGTDWLPWDEALLEHRHLGQTDRNKTINSNNNYAPDRRTNTNTNRNTSINSEIKSIITMKVTISSVLLPNEVSF